MPINANVSGGSQITASVGETQIDVGVSGGFGPSGAAGPAASVTVGTVTTGSPGSSASVVNAGSSSAAVLNFTIPAGATGATGPAGPAGATGPTGTTTWAGITDKPSTFAPSTHTHVAANITDFTSAVIAAAPPTTNASLLTSGTLADARLSANVVLTSDSRLTDSREWSADTITQAEAEAGTATTRRAFTALRVFQAIAAWWNGSAAKTKLDGIATGATANATDAQLRDRSTHTGTQAVSTISDAGTAATRNVPATGNATSTQVVLGSDTRLSDQRVPTDGSVTTAKLGSLTTVSAVYFASGAGGVSTIGTIRQTSVSDTVQFNVSTSGVVTVGAWQGTAIAVAYGGTGATTASAARTSLGLAIGTDVAAASHNQAWSTITSTPTTLAGYGITDAASSLHTHSAADITSGTIATARLPVVLEQTSTVGNSGTSTTLALTTGSVQTVTLNGNCTFTMPTATAGASITLILTQSGTFTATFTGVLWAGGTAPTITATASKVDVLVFVSNGTSWFGTAAQNF